MKIFDRDIWEEILETLLRNKTRSLLTAFGIFWGVFMLLLLMGGGNGLKSMLGNVFAGFASNSCFVASSTTSEPYKGFRKGRWWSLENGDIDRILNTCPEIEMATGCLFSRGTGINGDKTVNVTVKGVDQNYETIDNPKVRHGRWLNGTDLAERRKICIVGKRVAQDLYGSEDESIGQFLQVDGIYYRIVGVSGKDASGISIGGNNETTVYVPITLMQRVYNRGTSMDMLAFTAREGYKVSDVEDKVKSTLKRAHLIHPDDKQAVFSINAEAIFGMVDNLFHGISILVWMVGLGTLLSGVIGVSNIMMVTIRERTTEIGIRRAIGAKQRDVLFQVLAESMVLTLVAGTMGICMSVGILQVLENAAQEDSPGSVFQISFGLAIGAAIVLALLGLAAGTTPAMRAMQIRPVDAMRDE